MDKQPSNHTAIDEEIYFRKFGYFSIALSVMLLCKLVSPVIEDTLLLVVVGLIQMSMVALMIWFIFGLSKVKHWFSNRMFWLGSFSDEFLNQLNLKAYRFSFNVVVLTLFGFFIMEKFFSETLILLGFGFVIHMMLIMLFMSYGGATLYLLKDSDGD